MQYPVLFDKTVPLDDLPQVVQGLVLGESAGLLHESHEVAAPAELRHDVDVVLRHEDIVAFEDVLVFELAQGPHLVVEEVALDLVFYLGELDDLNGDLFFGEFVYAFVHG
jgi:hypothetical protein